MQRALVEHGANSFRFADILLNRKFPQRIEARDMLAA
jgi:hypothetical protein